MKICCASDILFFTVAAVLFRTIYLFCCVSVDSLASFGSQQKKLQKSYIFVLDASPLL